MSSKGYQVNVAQIERDAEMKNARAFRNSIRGKFILSQALTIAIKHLKKLEKRKDMYPKYGEHAQPSNRENMEYLKKELYPLYDVIPRSKEVLREWGIDKMNEAILRKVIREEIKRVIKEDEEAFSQPIPATIDRYMKKFIDAVARGNLNRKRKLAILGRTIVALRLDPQEVSKYARLVKREL